MIEPAEQATVANEAGSLFSSAARSAGWADYLVSDPGAHAPGLMLLRAPPALTPRLVSQLQGLRFNHAALSIQ